MKERRNYITRKEVTEEMPEVHEAPVKPKKRTGHISGCELLNVRKEPTPTAPVVAVLKTSDSFFVRDEDDNSPFYKVEKSEDVYGYSMKKYIAFDE